MAENPKGQKQLPVDIVRRGEYGTDVAGVATFCGLRALDPFLQGWILDKSPLHTLFPSLSKSEPGTHPNIVKAHPSHPVARFDARTDTVGTISSPNGTALFTFPNLSSFSISHLNEPTTILWSMSVLSAAKHIYQTLFTVMEPMSPGTTMIVAGFNTAMNTINSLLFTLRLSNPTYSDPSSLYIGAALFAIGIIVEPLAETQRKFYKTEQAKKLKASGSTEKPKPYTGGLFGMARNINYGAYTVWRTGYALASGGWIWGAIVGGFFFNSFAAERVPILEDYMKKKYGEDAWAEVESKVPYKLFPGIY